MERLLTNVAGARGLRVVYRAKVADLRSHGNTSQERTFWDRLLGVVTIAVVSAAGWAAIIALIYLLK